MRRYIRHPAKIPIEYAVNRDDPVSGIHAHNVGECGLAFHTDHKLTPGTRINLRIPLVDPPFETVAKVVWCHLRGDGFETGVEFSRSDQAYSVRMCEQVCHIENYRNEVKAAEGRELTPEEAAAEWVSKFAAKFPRTN
jgi:hypothetical protein